MNFISVMAVDFEVAQKAAVLNTGYGADTIGPVVHVAEDGNNSRQNAYVFQTSNDVTQHPLYVDAKLSDSFMLSEIGVEDGPVLIFGPEITVGG